MLSVKITANNLTEEMVSLILKKQWRLETESLEGEKLRKFVFSLCTNETHRDELTETLNSYRKEFGIKELEEDLYIENKPNYLDGFYVKTYQSDEVIINVKYSYFIKKAIERIEDGEEAKEDENSEEDNQPDSDKKSVMISSYFTTKQKVEFFKSLDKLNNIKLTPAQKLIIDNALSDSGISVYAMKRQSGKTLILSILNSINNKIVEMSHKGRIYDNGSLDFGTARVYKLNYYAEPLKNFNVDFDLLIDAYPYPYIANFCTNLILVDSLDSFHHDKTYDEIEGLMKQNKLLAHEYSHRFIITTNIDEIDSSSQLGPWLFDGMNDREEKQYFPAGNTLVHTIKNCKLFCVNEIPRISQNEKQ